jgi:breast cancer 2 susceptibility protein
LSGIATGFQTASKSFIAPSSAALKKAQAKMNEIWNDDDMKDDKNENAPSFSFNAPSSSFRSTLQSIDNFPESPLQSRVRASAGAKKFVSPLISKPAPISYDKLSSTPQSFVTARQHQLFSTPTQRSIPSPNGSLRSRPAKFVTPFKPGMKPGEVGRQCLPDYQTPRSALANSFVTTPKRPSVFTLGQRI